jgi:uncharacterized UBP type Zn finger protein
MVKEMKNKTKLIFNQSNVEEKKWFTPTRAGMSNIQVKLWDRYKTIEKYTHKKRSPTPKIQCRMIKFKGKMIKKKSEKTQSKLNKPTKLTWIMWMRYPK